jgi:hypothetical protein
VSAESTDGVREFSHSVEDGRAAIDPPQFRASEVRRHPTETLTMGHRTDVRGETAALVAMYFTLSSGGSRRELDHAGTKLNRTFRWGLSMLRSTNTTDCHVPSAGRPPNTGRVIEGLTNAGRTWSAP